MLSTTRVSYYASLYLQTILRARFYQEHSHLCWGQFKPQWWRDREREARCALAALREALNRFQEEGKSVAP